MRFIIMITTMTITMSTVIFIIVIITISITTVGRWLSSEVNVDFQPFFVQSSLYRSAAQDPYVYIYIYVCMYAYMYVCMCIYIYIYIHCKFNNLCFKQNKHTQVNVCCGSSETVTCRLLKLFLDHSTAKIYTSTPII